MGPWFKASSERPEKRGIYLAVLELVVEHVIHYTTRGILRYQYSKYRVDFSHFWFQFSVHCTHLNVPALDYTRIWQKNYVDSYQGWLKISEDRATIRMNRF